VSNSRCICIIQARMGSTRFPGKVLAQIKGKPMLAWVADRARQAGSIDDVIVATSIEEADQPIVDLCEERGYPCCRGSMRDVLDRYHQCAEAAGAEVVVRLTADCPLIDPGLIDQTVSAFLEAEPPVAFMTNRLPWDRTYPIGLDVEVCSKEALDAAWREAQLQHQREHVMPFLYENPERFTILELRSDTNYGDLRWTVDTPADLRLVREVVERLGGNEDFSWLDVLALFQADPELKRLNIDVKQKGHLDVDGSQTPGMI
jgi:spore coat polysaccharide biosynthesis protein SpsF